MADYDPVFSKVYSIGALGHGAGLFYRVSGYEPALELARGLAQWGLKRIFNDPSGRYDFWHFHHGLYSLMAVSEYALAADDREAMERVDACFRWALNDFSEAQLCRLDDFEVIPVSYYNADPIAKPHQDNQDILAP